MRGALITLGLIALSACTYQDRMEFNSEAGSELSGTGFGNATMQNTMVQSGARDYAISLTKKFAADVPNTVNFAFNSAALTPQARTALDRQADWIKQFPEVRFRVFGHTDLVGSSGYNKALGLKRARAVVGYLSSRGISRARLEAVVSFGETQPLVPVNAPNAENRRTVTEVSGFVKNHPTVMNGKYAMVVFRDYVTSASSAPTVAAVSAP
ncbi:hypothetical protein BFP70_07160 [Thioclava sp. SK-1]|nr:hypothetical protein BFP70_07160 [Thioclava sp. SK-1]